MHSAKIFSYTFFGWFESDTSIFLAMEYFELGDLDKYITSELTETDAKVIGRQLLEGLQVLHGYHLAHRDLKPANIFVARHAPDWWVKLGDFGIIRGICTKQNSTLTRIGTLDYMAPEILMGNDDEDEGFSYTLAVDIWSLGCVLFRLLIQPLPFPLERDLRQYLRLKKPFPTDILIRRNVSEDGVFLVSEMMKSNPSDRIIVDDALLHSWVSIQESPSTPRYHESYEKEGEVGPTNLPRIFAEGKCLPSGSTLRALSPTRRNAFSTSEPKIITSLLATLPRARGDTMLHRAVGGGKTELAASLLEEGADPDALYTVENGDSYTPLHLAAFDGFEPVIDLLNEYGANIDAQTDSGWTALNIAVKKWEKGVVRKLLNYSASVKLANNMDESPLLNAVTVGDVELLQMMLNAGADPSTKHMPDELTALHWAAKLNKTSAVMELLRSFPESGILDASSSTGLRPLHFAANEGFSDILFMLLHAGADPNVVAKHSISPLRAAVQQGHINAVKILIWGGARMDLIATDGVSLIDVARLRENEDMLSYLSSLRVNNTI